MTTDLKQSILLDLDVYGRNSSAGGALIHANDMAISNAIVFFLTADRGDYLYRSDLSGVLEELLFKLLTPEKAAFYQAKIQSALDDNFGQLIEDIRVSINPDFENRYYEIQVYYISTQTNESNQVIFYTRPEVESSVQKVITDIYFEDDNLLAFVLLKKKELLDPLVKNAEDGLWYWANYKFVNFSESSSNFSEIFNIINN